MRRILFALSALFAFVAAPASAAEQSAQALLDAIYAQYQGDAQHAHGVYLDKPAEIGRYFELSLAALMIADNAAAAKRDDVPALDGDPFIDAQDWAIEGLAIHIDSQDARAAQATVRFTNVKEPKTIRLALVHTKAGWRIADIIWNAKGDSLRGLYVKH